MNPKTRGERAGACPGAILEFRSYRGLGIGVSLSATPLTGATLRANATSAGTNHLVAAAN